MKKIISLMLAIAMLFAIAIIPAEAAATGWQWLCDATQENPWTPGWWLNPATTGKSISMEFRADANWNSIWAVSYASAYGVDMTLDLYDENMNFLESEENRYVGDNGAEVVFDYTYGPGIYTVVWRPTFDQPNYYFVLGASTLLEGQHCVVTAVCDNDSSGDLQSASVAIGLTDQGEGFVPVRHYWNSPWYTGWWAVNFTKETNAFFQLDFKVDYNWYEMGIFVFSPPGTGFNATLLNSDMEALATGLFYSVGDAFQTINFGKVFEPGNYTMIFTPDPAAPGYFIPAASTKIGGASSYTRLTGLYEGYNTQGQLPSEDPSYGTALFYIIRTDVPANAEVLEEQPDEIPFMLASEASSSPFAFNQASSVGVSFNVPAGKTLKKFILGRAPRWGESADTPLRLVCNLYQWDTDYATSVAGTPLTTVVVSSHVDCQNLIIDFGDEFASGKYLVEMIDEVGTVGGWNHPLSEDIALGAEFWLNGVSFARDWFPYSGIVMGNSEKSDIVKFTSASVTLTDGIAINFKVPEALLDAGAENISATFTFNGTQTVVTDYTVDNGKLVFSFRKIAPDMMGETIVATISADIGGETFTSTIRYSVLKYCRNLLNKYPGYVNKELRTLLVDLLNYGAASQAYTGRNADAPVTAGLDLYSAAYGTPIDPVLTDIEDSAYAVVEGAAATWKGVALALGDTVAIRFKFEAADIEGLKVKITGDEGNWTIDSSKFVVADAADTYYVMFNGLNAAQMSLPIYATVYDANNNAISNTLQYSIESYAASMQGGSDTALAKLTMAMMKYGNSAKIYRDGLKTPKDYILANDIQGTWVREVEAALFKDLVASKLEGNQYAGVVDYLELDGVVLPVALDFNSDGTFATRLATDAAKTTVDNIVKAAARAYFIEVEHINEFLVDMMLNSLLSASGVRDMYMGNLVEGVYTVEDDLVYISNTTEGLVAPENASEAVIHGDVMVITKLSDIAADAVTILGGYPILVFRQTGN